MFIYLYINIQIQLYINIYINIYTYIYILRYFVFRISYFVYRITYFVFRITSLFYPVPGCPRWAPHLLAVHCLLRASFLFSDALAANLRVASTLLPRFRHADECQDRGTAQVMESEPCLPASRPIAGFTDGSNQ